LIESPGSVSQIGLQGVSSRGVMFRVVEISCPAGKWQDPSPRKDEVTYIGRVNKNQQK